jgi:ankyrin repeat protein
VPTAKLLLDKGADVNHKDAEGTPPLHNAVWNSDAEMVSLLIKTGAKVKTKDQYGLTALVYAIKQQNKEIEKMIRDAGGNY